VGVGVGGGVSGGFSREGYYLVVVVAVLLLTREVRRGGEEKGNRDRDRINNGNQSIDPTNERVNYRTLSLFGFLLSVSRNFWPPTATAFSRPCRRARVWRGVG
jgi:hypothetical protein